jgi:hypothetical protein
LGRSLAAAACKGGTHGGAVLLQDVRLEGRFVAATVKESLERLPGLKGTAVPGPRTTGPQGVKEKCMGGTYSGVWGALGERMIPVPTYGIEAEGRWVAVGIRGRELARKIAFVSVYRARRAAWGGGRELGDEVRPPGRISFDSGGPQPVLC